MLTEHTDTRTLGGENGKRNAKMAGTNDFALDFDTARIKRRRFNYGLPWDRQKINNGNALVGYLTQSNLILLELQQHSLALFRTPSCSVLVVRSIIRIKLLLQLDLICD